jgi:hypothetical protein
VISFSGAGVPFKVIVPEISPAEAACKPATSPVIVSNATVFFILVLVFPEKAGKTYHPRFWGASHFVKNFTSAERESFNIQPPTSREHSNSNIRNRAHDREGQGNSRGSLLDAALEIGI